MEPTRRAEGPTTTSPEDTLVGLEGFFDRTSDGILCVAPDGRIVRANPAARAILLVTDDSLEGSGVKRWLPQVEVPATRTTSELESTAVSARDERFPVEFSVTSCDGRGHTWIVFRDISKRRSTEVSSMKYAEDLEKIVHKRTRDLDDLRLRYRTLYDLAPVLDVELDSQGAIASANRKACITLGVSIDRLIGLSLADLAVGAERRTLERTLDDVRSGSLAPFETQLRSTDGSVHHILFHSCRIDASRMCVRLVGLDVTARREAERLVDQSLDLAEAQRARMERILRGIGEGVVVTDPDGQVRLMNGRAERMLRMNETQAFGRDLFAEQPDETFATQWTEFVRGDDDVVRAECVSEDHRFAMTATRIRTPDGRPAGCAVIVRDITDERREFDSKLSFLSSVTTELRAPLGAIRGLSESLLATDRLPHAEDSQSALMISEETRRLQHVLDDLSAIVHLESRSERIVARSADFTEVLHDARTEILPFAEERGITIAVDRDDEPGTGAFDPEKIRRVIDNLLENAVRYSGEGGRVEIRFRRHARRLECSVTDSGRGIAPEVLAGIFDCAAPEAAGFSSGGRGLGLYLCRVLVRLHGGEISATSEPGAGSTFSFWIPVRHVEAPESGHEAATAEGAAFDDALEDLGSDPIFGDGSLDDLPIPDIPDAAIAAFDTPMEDALAAMEEREDEEASEPVENEEYSSNASLADAVEDLRQAEDVEDDDDVVPDDEVQDEDSPPENEPPPPLRIEPPTPIEPPRDEKSSGFFSPSED